MLPIDQERSIESRKFIEITEGRLEEIIENVWFQIQSSEYGDKLLGGIILTGGGSNMKDIDKAFMNHSHIDKIRIAKFVTQAIDSTSQLINEHDGTMNTILALLAKGDMNCAGDEINANGDLFASQQASSTNEIHIKARQVTEIAPGVVRTEAEKHKAEEEARKKKEAEEEAARQVEEEEKKRVAEEKKKNSIMTKAGKKLKNFFESIIKEEE
jgi:cell division protein FtsA